MSQRILIFANGDAPSGNIPDRQVRVREHKDGRIVYSVTPDDGRKQEWQGFAPRVVPTAGGRNNNNNNNKNNNAMTVTTGATAGGAAAAAAQAATAGNYRILRGDGTAAAPQSVVFLSRVHSWDATPQSMSLTTEQFAEVLDEKSGGGGSDFRNQKVKKMERERAQYGHVTKQSAAKPMQVGGTDAKAKMQERIRQRENKVRMTVEGGGAPRTPGTPAAPAAAAAGGGASAGRAGGVENDDDADDNDDDAGPARPQNSAADDDGGDGGEGGEGGGESEKKKKKKDKKKGK